MRMDGRIAWLDLTGGKGSRPIVRFKLDDILSYEERFRQCPADHAVEGGRR